MATPNSQVKLYKVGFNKDMNCVVDDLATYLSTWSSVQVATYNDFMYTKIELDIEIKIPFNQENVANQQFNYVSIKNSDTNRVFYYYVRDIVWLSQAGCKVYLSMDTLNTFVDLLQFTDNTKIIRQHKDRFRRDLYTVHSTNAIRVIDRPSEIQGLTKYKISENRVNDSSFNGKWYLVYANQTDEENSPVQCFICYESDIVFQGTGSGYPYTFFNTGSSGDLYLIKNGHISFQITKTDNTTQTLTVLPDQTYYIKTTTSNYVTVGGKGADTNTYDVVNIEFTTPAYLTLYAPGFNTSNVSNAQMIEIAHSGEGDIECAGSGTWYARGIDSIDRTSQKLIKIIECPYMPIQIPSSGGYYQVPSGCSIVTDNTISSNASLLRLNDISKELGSTLNYTDTISTSVYECTLPATTARITATKDPYYESKLFHSDFQSVFFQYDSFTKEFQLENLKPTTATRPTIGVEYKQANTITSNLGFRFIFSNGTYTDTETYNKYLVCRRNNEYPIFNSSYLNYIRNGYNYDIKNRNTQLGTSIAGTVISAVGGALALAFGGVVGKAAGISLITSTLMSATSLTASMITSEANIEQKIQEAKNTANSVATSDDLNLLNWYCGNKLSRLMYRISDEQRQNIFDLFYKTGYLCNTNGIPDTTSRYRFNFVQCTPEFSTKSNPEWQEYINDVIARFELGVTYFHTFTDFTQQRENWESWLMP